MIRVWPRIEVELRCPRDQTPLDLVRMLIPGMRTLAEARCATCSGHFWADLPVSHAIRGPVFLDIETGEVLSEHPGQWFSESLRASYLARTDDSPLVRREVRFESARIVVLNGLDYLYGHSLLKLLNAQRHLDRSTDLGICVLLPRALSHLCPDGVAELWEVDWSFSAGKGWYSGLARWIDEQVRSRQEVFVSRAYSHVSPRHYDLTRFVRGLPVFDQSEKRHPIVVFNYRKDRTWGRTAASQAFRIAQLQAALSAAFPQLLFVVIGLGRDQRLLPKSPSILDLRADSLDPIKERQWLAVMATADCAIGVHGSNMLLASGLARTTVELLPRSRYGNLAQDLLFSGAFDDPRDSLFRVRILYGNDALTDVDPLLVANVTTSAIADGKADSDWLKADMVPPAEWPSHRWGESTSSHAQAAQWLEGATGRLPSLKRRLEIVRRAVRDLIRAWN